jgi:glyoxylase-like metal-dependent hydrolase (beta-lactamase superfamily II)
VLSHHLTGQRLERFCVDATLQPGTAFVAGAREWQVLAAPGHDPHSVILFDAAHGVLLSADALWERGFGVVFPEVAGEPGFDDVAATLELIATLPVRVVVPGHGAPFTDAAAALQRSRQRLAGLRADPARHAQHALKVLLKYHLMEERAQPLPELLNWAEQAPLLVELWRRFAPPSLPSARAWTLQALDQLAGQGALRCDGETVLDA